MNDALENKSSPSAQANPDLWDRLWTNVNLATMQDGRYSEINRGAIATTGSRISWLGPQDHLAAPPERLAKKVIDGKGHYITPGLIDCHTHLVFGSNRAKEFEQRLMGVSYEEIANQGGGIRSTVSATRTASLEELIHATTPRLQSLLDTGVTSVEIKSGYGLDIDTELRMLQVMSALENSLPVSIEKTYLGAHTVPVEYERNRDGYLDLICNELLPLIHENNSADAVDIFCETIGFNIAESTRILQAATALNLNVKMHADQLTDMGASALAAEFSALSADHLEHCPKTGVSAMADNSSTAVLLPGAFYYLRESRKPPVELFRTYEVPMAIATDLNPGSSPVASLLTIMNMACTLFGLTPEEALSAVTSNAARALGLQDDRGTLEVGKRADFVLWDIQSPAELSYWVGFNPCVERIKNGVPVRGYATPYQADQADK
jgi:imidazolonepropionase